MVATRFYGSAGQVRGAANRAVTVFGKRRSKCVRRTEIVKLKFLTLLYVFVSVFVYKLILYVYVYFAILPNLIRPILIPLIYCMSL